MGGANYTSKIVPKISAELVLPNGAIKKISAALKDKIHAILNGWG